MADIDNIQIAIRELNNLYRLWKNELGPVSRDKREDLWKRFQKQQKKYMTKKINQKHRFYKIKNYETKVELINKIKKESKGKKIHTTNGRIQ